MRIAAGILAIVGLVGCASAVDPSPGEEGRAVEADEAELAAAGPTYFTAVRDARRCAAPMCGGYFVSRVNRPWTRCADGYLRESCYVASLDVTSLQLAPEENVDALVHGAREGIEVVLAGDLRVDPTGARPFGVLKVTEAWRAPAPVALFGDFYNVGRSGLSCDAEDRSQCVLRETRINSSFTRLIRAVDFSYAPEANTFGVAPPAGTAGDYAVAKGDLDLSFGLLVVGGHDRYGVLYASQYFIHLPGPSLQKIRGRGL